MTMHTERQNHGRWARKWVSVVRLPDGHRLFRTVGEPPRFAIADESGRFPHDTEDGTLWLDPTRCLTVEKDQSFDPPREHISIPLRDEDGKESRTPSDMATLLVLSRMFKWTIEDSDRATYYNAADTHSTDPSPVLHLLRQALGSGQLRDTIIGGKIASYFDAEGIER